MKIEYRVEEKSAFIKNCWLSLNRGHFFKTKEDAQKYLAQYQTKHPNVILRIIRCEWVNENTLIDKEDKR